MRRKYKWNLETAPRLDDYRPKAQFGNSLLSAVSQRQHALNQWSNAGVERVAKQARQAERKVKENNKSKVKVPYRDNNGYDDTAILLHYPNYKGSIFGGTKNILSNKINRLLGNPQLSVGHNAVITVDENGHTKYYEYGRYNPNTKGVIGYAEDNLGNVVNVSIPDKRRNESDSAYIARVQGRLPHANRGSLLANVIDKVNKDSIDNYFINLSNDKNRKPYTIWSVNPRTCASVVNEAISHGLQQDRKDVVKQRNTNNNLHDILGGILSRYMRKGSLYNTLNPFASGNYFDYYTPISRKYEFK